MSKVLLQVAATRAGQRHLKTCARRKAKAQLINISAYQYDFITTQDYLHYDNIIQQYGFLHISTRDSNYGLLREIAKWV